MRFTLGIQLVLLAAIFGLGLFVTPTWAAGEGVAVAVESEVQAASLGAGLFAQIDLAMIDRLLQVLVSCVLLKVVLEAYRVRHERPQTLSRPFLRTFAAELVQSRRQSAVRRYAPVMPESSK